MIYQNLTFSTVYFLLVTSHYPLSAARLPGRPAVRSTLYAVCYPLAIEGAK
jgi:hypothetical protein